MQRGASAKSTLLTAMIAACVGAGVAFALPDPAQSAPMAGQARSARDAAVSLRADAEDGASESAHADALARRVQALEVNRDQSGGSSEDTSSAGADAAELEVLFYAGLVSRVAALEAERSTAADGVRELRVALVGLVDAIKRRADLKKSAESQEAAAEWLAKLRNADPKERDSALRKARRMSPAATAPYVFDRLWDENARVRGNAAEYFRKNPDPAASQQFLNELYAKLTQMLDDPIGIVAHKAADTLAEYQQFDVLYYYDLHGSQLRAVYTAASKLARERGKPAMAPGLPRLRDFVRTGTAEERRWAVFTLRHCSTKVDAELVRPLLESPDAKLVEAVRDTLRAWGADE